MQTKNKARTVTFKSNVADEYTEALKELSDAVGALSGKFDSPLNRNNVDLWVNLNDAQARAKSLLD